MNANPRPRLIVSADDFGRSEVVNEGVIVAHENGIVTSAGLMVRWPAAPAAAHYCRRHPALDVGLHFDFGEWEFRAGRWKRSYEVVDSGDERAVFDEAMAQIESFRGLVGREPTHLDSHQSVHRREPLASALDSVAWDLGLPLRHRSAVSFCGAFHGRTSKGRPFPEGVSSDALGRIIRNLPAGVTELATHPAARAEIGDSYGPGRVAELEALCSAAARRAIAEAGVDLGTFREVVAGRLVGEPGGANSFLDRAVRAYKAGNWDESESWLAAAMKTRDSFAPHWLWKSRIEARRNSHYDAFQSICRALELHPGWPEGERHLHTLITSNGPRILARVEQEAASDPDVRALLLKRYFRIGQYRQVIAIADDLLRGDGGHDAGFIRDLAAQRLGRDDRPVARRSGGVGEVAARVRVLLDLRCPEEAWSLVGKNPESCSPDLVALVGAGLWAEGSIRSACSAFRIATSSDSSDGDSMEWCTTAHAEARVLAGRWNPPPIDLAPSGKVPGTVLHVVASSRPYAETGYAERTHAVGRCQVAVGMDPHFVTPLGFPHDAGFEAGEGPEFLDGVTYHRLGIKGGIPSALDERLDMTLERLGQLAGELAPSVIHAATDFRNAEVALRLGRALGVPVVYEVRGFWEDTWLARTRPVIAGPERYRWWRRRETACMRAADRVVTLSEAMKERLIERGIPSGRVAVIPNGADVERFKPRPADPDLSRSLGIRPGEVVIGEVTTLSSYEGLDTLLWATAALAARGRPVRTLIVGDGEEREALELLAHSLGLAGIVVFAGRVPHDDVHRYYNLMDVFVVPRTADPVSDLVTPMKPFEAMASGCPLVAADTRALGSLVDECGGGVLFPPGDADALAESLDPLVKNEFHRRDLGMRGRRWVARHRTWNEAGDRYRELYESLGAWPSERNSWALRQRGVPAP
jgi:glycosyltransferase involved in cell wall biosynthesis/predicted glycoside hydrolase/deacetylase ChbG (UPF0249 family)